ncbi:D-alanyl-D-alanine carboxypeptidase [Altererythrobacter sp.]|nr:D-alanyl-D-alanine carboxypeptidase [Altererythrobacter sp.]
MKFPSGTLAVCAALMLAVPPPAQARPAPVPQEIPVALLIDLSSGQTLYRRNASRRFVPASITKVMTAYTAFALLKSGALREGQSFTFSEAAAADWERTGSTMFLAAGDDATVQDLLMGITTVSANDGSIVLAEGATSSVFNWIELMNENAALLKMSNSHFGTPNGWPDEGRTFTTAEDLVTLGAALIREHPARFAQYFGHSGLRTNGYAQSNHDPLIDRVEGADGIKTGFTNQAGFGFLGTAKRGDRRLLMVVGGADEGSLRDQTARDLIEWGFANFQSTSLFKQGEVVGQARVQDGAEGRVQLSAPSAIRFAIPRGLDGNVSLAIKYEGPLRAPIVAGEEVAQLEITAPGMEPSLVPLVAQTNVAKAGFFQRILNSFSELVA